MSLTAEHDNVNMVVNGYKGWLAMPKVPPDKIQTTVYLPKRVHTEPRIETLREDTSMTKLIVRVVSRELDIGKVSRKRE